MLKITIPKTELFDERTETFVNIPEQTLELEHSLFSVSKWESKWEKPFLTDKQHTPEEFIDYIKDMVINEKYVDDRVFSALTQEHLIKIADYMNAKMTATTIRKERSGGRAIITAEIIYQWMIALEIPFECQYWHLNKLITLIEVCNEKSKPPKKMSMKDTMRQNRTLNRSRLRR